MPRGGYRGGYRKPAWNERFFDEWSPEMAYVLGFIWADGSVHWRSPGYKISMAQMESEILKDIAKSMGCKRPKAVSQHKTSGIFSIQVSSKYAVKRLIEIGIVPRKSFCDPAYPKIEAFESHFVRGFFDGDGSFYNGKQTKASTYRTEIIFNGSRFFLEGVERTLRKNLLVKRKDLCLHTRGKNLCKLIYGVRREVLKIRSWMYKEATLYLDRKYRAMFNMKAA